MNKLFLFLFLLPFGLFAQQLPTDETGKVTFSEVVEVPGVSQKVLHDKAKLWIAESFKSANNVIQLDTDSLIIVKGIKTFNMVSKYAVVPGKFNFTQKLYFKNGKYKYEITDFSPDGNIIYTKDSFVTPENYPIKSKAAREGYASAYKAITENMKELDASFKSGFTKLLTAKSDW